jgi:putative MATE family efflux protein
MSTIDDTAFAGSAAQPRPTGAAIRNRTVERLLKGSIGGTLWRLAAPNTIGFLVASGVTVAEMWYVGQLGTQSLAGLALGFPMFMLMVMLSAGAMGGAMAAAVARAIGAGQPARAEALVWHALVIALVAGGMFSVVYLIIGPAFFAFLGGSGDTLAAAIAYADVIFAGILIVWLFNTLGSVLRGAGDMKSPAFAMILAAAIQVPLSGALALGWGPLPRLGVAGVAWGTLAAFSVATVFLGALLWSGQRGIRLRLTALSFRRTLFADILRVGMVASVSPVLTVATVILLTGLVSRFGDAALAGFGIGSRLEFLLIPVVFGIGAALIAMVGTNIGAGQIARAHRIGWIGAAAAAGITGAIGTVAALWPEAWASLFTDNAAVLLAAGAYLVIVGPFYAFHGLGLSLYFASQGAGTVVWPVVAGAVRLVVAAGGGIVAIQAFDMGFNGLLAFVAAGMVVFGLGTAASVLFGAWRRV